MMIIVFGNYQIAKLVQHFFLELSPNLSYIATLVVPWIGIGIILCLTNPLACGLRWNSSETKQNWRSIFLLLLSLALGLGLFAYFGVTKYFHGVKYPIIFFLFTPIAEELIFRGWIYQQIQRLGRSAIFWSAIFFGLHHLQYFNYHFTTFAIFQITYTFILGIFLGKIRKDSGSIYLPIIAHTLLNYITLLW